MWLFMRSLVQPSVLLHQGAEKCSVSLLGCRLGGNLEKAVHEADLMVDTSFAGEAVASTVIRMISFPLIVVPAVRMA